MNFKYFLRGLGVGIVFSAIICLAVYNGRGNIKMSDEEIIKRAKQLGYVSAEDTVGKQIEQLKKDTKDHTSEINENEQKDNSKTEEVASNNQENAQTTKTDVVNNESKKNDKEKDREDSKSTEKMTTSKKKENTTEKVTTETTTETVTENSKKLSDEQKKEEKNKDEITFSIEAGSSSYPVCLKLKELGLVENAEEFDTFLVENGYANRISVGTHSLKKGMSYHDIAEAISDPLE